MASSDLIQAEMREIHEYARGLFGFEAKWNGVIWGANAVASAWLLAVETSYLDESGVCLGLVVANLIAVIGLSIAAPRYKLFGDHLTHLKALLSKTDTVATELQPNLGVETLYKVLVAMRRFSLFLFVVWGGVGIWKLLLHYEIIS